MTAAAAPADSVSALLAALDAATKAEQLAAFGYGTLGPQLPSADQMTQARTCEQAHRALSATASTLAATAAATPPAAASPPVGSAGSYNLPGSAVDAGSAQQLAALLEQGCASAWRYVLAQLARSESSASAISGAGSAWTISVGALRDSAVRAVSWRRLIDASTASVAFPGI